MKPSLRDHMDTNAPAVATIYAPAMGRHSQQGHVSGTFDFKGAELKFR
jgi:hypothetical protein